MKKENYKKSTFEQLQEDVQSNRQLSRKLKDIDTQESKRLSNCFNWFKEDVYVNKNYFQLETNKTVNHRCKSKFCKVCEKRKNHMFYVELEQKVNQLPKEYGLIFLTLTIKNPPLTELGQTLNNMSNGLVSFRKKVNYYLTGKNTNPLGYFSSTEITYVNKDGSKKIENDIQMCHPHKHIILVVPLEMLKNKKLNPKTFQLMWKKSMGMENVNVHINFIRNTNKTIKELIKYNTKYSEYLDYPELIPEIKKQTKGKRLYSSSGLLKVTQKKGEITLKEAAEEKALMLELDYKKVLSFKRIWSNEKKYFVIYDISWKKKEMNLDEKKQILFELSKIGKINEMELNYIIKTNRIDIEVLNNQKFERFENIYSGISKYKSQQEIKIEEHMTYDIKYGKKIEYKKKWLENKSKFVIYDINWKLEETLRTYEKENMIKELSRLGNISKEGKMI
jgi:hypothetical protein